MRRNRGRRKRFAHYAEYTEPHLATIENCSKRKTILCHKLCLYCLDINDGVSGLDQNLQLDRILVRQMNRGVARIRRKLHLVVKELRRCDFFHASY